MAVTKVELSAILPQRRRTEATEEQIKALSDSILEHGLNHPVVISDGVVVDGLARIEAVRKAGFDAIEAVVSTTFQVALHEVGKAREGKMSIGRFIDLCKDASAMLEAHSFQARHNAGRIRQGLMVSGKRKSVPLLFVEASGLAVGKVTILRKALKLTGSDERVVGLLEKTIAGKLTVYGLLHAMERMDAPPPELPPADEVRGTTDRALRVIATAIAQMERYKGAHSLTIDERRKLRNEISKLRIRMVTLRRDIGISIRREGFESE